MSSLQKWTSWENIPDFGILFVSHQELSLSQEWDLTSSFSKTLTLITGPHSSTKIVKTLKACPFASKSSRMSMTMRKLLVLWKCSKSRSDMNLTSLWMFRCWFKTRRSKTWKDRTLVSRMDHQQRLTLSNKQQVLSLVADSLIIKILINLTSGKLKLKNQSATKASEI